MRGHIFAEIPKTARTLVSPRPCNYLSNGTCNYVLDALRQGADFESAVGSAQAAGFAEADPSRDLSGADAADKLVLIARVGFSTGLSASSISVCGINVRSAGAGVYIVATAMRSGDALDACVAPQILAAEDFLAGARGAENRIEIELDDGRILRLDGRGAGRWPTTTSVCGDVIEVWLEHCRQRRNPVTEIDYADAAGRGRPLYLGQVDAS